jgi:hypothetical protein
MTETELDLARRLAAHPRWRVMRGMEMLVASGAYAHRYLTDSEPPYDGEIPDLADPATQGCLWVMLDEATPDRSVSSCRDGRWIVAEYTWTDDGTKDWECDPLHPDAYSKGEALARALLAAWGEA